MKKWKDIVGVLLVFAGVGSILGGVHGVSGGETWGGPAIGAGAAVNVVAFRALRGTTTTRRAEQTPSDRATPDA